MGITTYLNNLSTNTRREERMFDFYRFVSVSLTSLFYLVGPPNAPILFKAIVVLSLVASSIIIARLYRKNQNSKKVKLLIILETLGITLLLIPTGGLESPFIWYALNPVLYAARYLKASFCWLTLLFYVVGATTMSVLFFNMSNATVLTLLLENSQVILILVLITLAVQMLSELMKELDLKADLLNKNSKRLQEVNEKLEEANHISEQSVNYIMELYPMLEAFNNKENRKNLPQLFADYAKKLTRSPNAFFGLFPFQLSSISVNVEKDTNEDQLKQEINSNWPKCETLSKKQKVTLCGKRFLVMTVETSFQQRGLIGIELIDDREEVERQLSFLAELSGMMIERFHLETVSSELLIAEEQNRIANEMHDSVSQRLFAIVFALHALEAKHSKLTPSELSLQLKTIKGSAHSTIQELRSTIHQLSINKRKDKPLKAMIERFLQEQTSLYNVNLNLDLAGDETLLSHSLQQGVYRIICEASGNSLRHGMCKQLSVKLTIDEAKLQLMIKDDGNGFDIKNSSKEYSQGLGLKNIHNLVSTFNGMIDLHSEVGKGTTIAVIVPIRTDVISLKSYKEAVL